MVAKALSETTREAISEDVIMYSAVQVYTGKLGLRQRSCQC